MCSPRSSDTPAVAQRWANSRTTLLMISIVLPPSSLSMLSTSPCLTLTSSCSSRLSPRPVAKCSQSLPPAFSRSLQVLDPKWLQKDSIKNPFGQRLTWPLWSECGRWHWSVKLPPPLANWQVPTPSRITIKRVKIGKLKNKSPRGINNLLYYQASTLWDLLSSLASHCPMQSWRPWTKMKHECCYFHIVCADRSLAMGDRFWLFIQTLNIQFNIQFKPNQIIRPKNLFIQDKIQNYSFK